MFNLALGFKLFSQEKPAYRINSKPEKDKVEVEINSI